MSQPAKAARDVATDPHLDPQVRALLIELNKDPSPFWELPQPKPQDILTGLQNKTPVDTSGVTIDEKTIAEGDRSVKLYIMKPEQITGKPGVLLFIHGGVWIVGNFENHKRLVHDLVVNSGQVAVFVEYTSLPQAKYPTQLEECYAALKWIAAHAHELGADGSRIAVAGNSVGGNMTAALTLMAKDRNGPKISYQVLFIPATDASVDTPSYHEFATGHFLSRAFMKYGWDLYAPDEKTRNNPYVSPLRASLDELKGLPPALVITAENDPLRTPRSSRPAKASTLTSALTSVSEIRSRRRRPAKSAPASPTPMVEVITWAERSDIFCRLRGLARRRASSLHRIRIWEEKVQYAVGLRVMNKSEHCVVEAEDALIAALKVKLERPDAVINYVRRQNRRGDARNPVRALARAD